MSKVVALMSMSLDGYVADPDDGGAGVLAWYFNSGDVLGNPTVVAGVGVTHLRYPVREG